jgi:hypothetical protein
MTMKVKDSGERRSLETGSVRDKREGKGRFDLIPPHSEEILAKVYEAGAVKYGDNNWLKGQPLSWYVDSMKRHLNKALQGITDEDHFALMMWNSIALVQTREMIRNGELPQELNDLKWGQVWTETEKKDAHVQS